MFSENHIDIWTLTFVAVPRSPEVSGPQTLDQCRRIFGQEKQNKTGISSSRIGLQAWWRTIEFFPHPSRVRLSTGNNYPETFTSNGQPDIDSLSDLLEDDSPPEEGKKDSLVFAKNNNAFGFVDVCECKHKVPMWPYANTSSSWFQMRISLWKWLHGQHITRPI